MGVIAQVSAASTCAPSCNLVRKTVPHRRPAAPRHSTTTVTTRRTNDNEWKRWSSALVGLRSLICPLQRDQRRQRRHGKIFCTCDVSATPTSNTWAMPGCCSLPNASPSRAKRLTVSADAWLARLTSIAMRRCGCSCSASQTMPCRLRPGCQQCDNHQCVQVCRTAARPRPPVGPRAAGATP